MKEFIKQLDDLSPVITLYYNDSKKHSSFFSGILTILHYSIVFLVICIYSSYVFTHTSSSSAFYKTFLADPGIFDITEDNFFHYISFKGGVEYDSKAISIIGVEMRPSVILENNRETTFDHWIYENCTINFKSVLNTEVSTGSEASQANAEKYGLCVTKFYNAEEHKVYSKNEKGFKYPTIQHGTGNDNSVPYGIIVQACQNETSIKGCYSQGKITEFFGQIFSLVMNVQDKYVNTNNYKEPFVNYINSFEIRVDNEAIINTNMYFSSTIVINHLGFITDSIKNIWAYSYEQFVANTYDKKDTEILTMFYFWMKNEADVYKRKYMKIQEILPSISGISTVSYCFFFLINMISHNFVVFYNFNHFMLLFEGTQRRTGEFKKLIKKASTNTIYVLKGSCQKLPQITPKYNRMTPMVKRVHLNWRQIIKHLLIFKFTKAGYINKMLNFRKKLLSEEKLIKNNIFLNDFRRFLPEFIEGNSEKLQGMETVLLNQNFYDPQRQDSYKNNSGTLEFLNFRGTSVIKN